jgi:DNA primase large subunit
LLFRFRAERETPEGILEFMSRYNLNFELASDEEKRTHDMALRIASEAKPMKVEIPGSEGGFAEVYYKKQDPLYKVPFTDVTDLLKGQEVHIYQGLCYVPAAKMISSIVAKFRAYNSFSLVAANKFLPAALRDERLKPMLENMSKTYVGPEYNGSKKVSTGDETIWSAEVGGRGWLSFRFPLFSFFLCHLSVRGRGYSR